MQAKYVEVLERSPIDYAAVAVLCRRGLPDSVRIPFWKICMGFYPVDKEFWNSIEDASLNEYNSILQATCVMNADGNAVTKTDTHRTIDMDVIRTMASLHFFAGGSSQAAQNESLQHVGIYSPAQQALRRILYSVSSVNSGVGYVQGMNEVAGHLLYVFAEGRIDRITKSSEATVFFSFQTLLTYLGDGFSTSVVSDNAEIGAIEAVRHYEKVLQFLDIELLTHLQQIGVHSEHYALRWLMLLFTQEFREPDRLRVWDFLLSFGIELGYTALYVAAAMCHFLRDSILSKNNLSEVIPLLHHYPPCDVNDFLRIAMRWIAQYKFELVETLKSAGPEEIGELRRAHGLGKPDVLTGIVNSISGWWNQR